MKKHLRDKLPNGAFAKVPKFRSRTMSSIKDRGNRSTELCFRLALVRSSIRGWTVQHQGLIGKPDFFFPTERIAVFVDGCFWHGCSTCGHVPKTNTSFWRSKLNDNKIKDKNTNHALTSQGIRVVRIWEHEIKKDLSYCINRLEKLLHGEH